MNTQPTMNNQKPQITLFEIPKLHDIIKLMDSGLDAANRKGVYGFNEAFRLKTGINQLVLVVNTLNVYQQEQIRKMKEEQAARQAQNPLAQKIIKKSVESNS